MRGAPDDSNVLSTSTFYRLDDMAELAVRLGSPVQYLRSGNIVFCTTFEDGFNCGCEFGREHHGNCATCSHWTNRGGNSVETVLVGGLYRAYPEPQRCR